MKPVNSVGFGLPLRWKCVASPFPNGRYKKTKRALHCKQVGFALPMLSPICPQFGWLGSKPNQALRPQTRSVPARTHSRLGPIGGNEVFRVGCKPPPVSASVGDSRRSPCQRGVSAVGRFATGFEPSTFGSVGLATAGSDGLKAHTLSRSSQGVCDITSTALWLARQSIFYKEFHAVP